MKKEIKGFIAGFICALTLLGAVFAAGGIYAEIYPNNVSIYANNTLINGDNITYNDKTYAPLRAIAESLGCSVDYNDATKAVFLSSRFSFGDTVRLTNKTYTVNSQILQYKRDDGSIEEFVSIRSLSAIGLRPEINLNSMVYNFNVKEKTSIASSPNTTTEKNTPTEVKFPLHLYSYDGKTYLGKLVTDTSDPDGLWNESSIYGNKQNQISIWNTFATYGSQFATTSAFNPTAIYPPKIVNAEGGFFGYLTANSNLENAYTIEQLLQYLKDNNQ